MDGTLSGHICDIQGMVNLSQVRVLQNERGLLSPDLLTPVFLSQELWVVSGGPLGPAFMFSSNYPSLSGRLAGFFLMKA